MAHYITIIANIFHIYAVYQFSQLLFQKKPNRKLLEFILYFLYFQINSFCFVYFHSIIWNVLSNLIPFFCITLFYPTTWSHRILSVFSIYIVSMAIDILCATVSIWFDYTLFFTSGFAAALLLLIVARIAAHFKLYRKEVVPRLGIFYVINILFIPLGSIFLAHYIARTLSWRSLIAAIILLLLNISVFSLYDHLIGLMKKQHTVHLIEQQNKTYQEQIKAVQQSQMRLRFLRHDIKNHLFQMQHYLDTNDIDGLRSYISDTEYHLDLARSTTYTQHEQINSILNYKLMPLQLDDTNLDIDIRLPEELPYAPFDLTVLLGNLLDNAAEATEKVFPKEQRHIILKMRVKFGALQLNIRNRYDNILPDESGTRKPDKKRHGLGMKSVQDIVDRYHGKILDCAGKGLVRGQRDPVPAGTQHFLRIIKTTKTVSLFQRETVFLLHNAQLFVKGIVPQQHLVFFRCQPGICLEIVYKMGLVKIPQVGGDLGQRAPRVLVLVQRRHCRLKPDDLRQLFGAESGLIPKTLVNVSGRITGILRQLFHGNPAAGADHQIGRVEHQQILMFLGTDSAIDVHVGTHKHTDLLPEI